MASSVAEIGRQVQQSESVTQEAVRQAEQTNERITELSQSAGRIGAVVKMINATGRVIGVKYRIEAEKYRAEAARLRDELVQSESTYQSGGGVAAR